MTYLIYTAWTYLLILLAGELDRYLSGWVLRRFRLPVPEIHPAVTTITALLIPGSGQFLNGQPLKAAFVLIWPLLVMFRAPVPPPWQMLLLKTGALLAPWWFAAWLDGAISSWLLWRARQRSFRAEGEAERQRLAQMAAFLDRRKS